MDLHDIPITPTTTEQALAALHPQPDAAAPTGKHPADVTPRGNQEVHAADEARGMEQLDRVLGW